jgi:hypothetical protein
MKNMGKKLLKSRLRPSVRQHFVERKRELLAEVAQIDALLEEDDAHTIVGMPAFAVHERNPLLLRQEWRHAEVTPKHRRDSTRPTRVS